MIEYISGVLFLLNCAQDSCFVCSVVFTDFFTHIRESYSTNIGIIVQSPQCQWYNPKEYRWTDHMDNLIMDNVIVIKPSIPTRLSMFWNILHMQLCDVSKTNREQFGFEKTTTDDMPGMLPKEGLEVNHRIPIVFRCFGCVCAWVCNEMVSIWIRINRIQNWKSTLRFDIPREHIRFNIINNSKSCLQLGRYIPNATKKLCQS